MNETLTIKNLSPEDKIAIKNAISKISGEQDNFSGNAKKLLLALPEKINEIASLKNQLISYGDNLRKLQKELNELRAAQKSKAQPETPHTIDFEVSKPTNNDSKPEVDSSQKTVNSTEKAVDSAEIPVYSKEEEVYFTFKEWYTAKKKLIADTLPLLIITLIAISIIISVFLYAIRSDTSSKAKTPEQTNSAQTITFDSLEKKVNRLEYQINNLRK